MPVLQPGLLAVSKVKTGDGAAGGEGPSVTTEEGCSRGAEFRLTPFPWLSWVTVLKGVGCLISTGGPNSSRRIRVCGVLPVPGCFLVNTFCNHFIVTEYVAHLSISSRKCVFIHSSLARSLPMRR